MANDSKTSLRERFFVWYWRGGMKSRGERLHALMYDENKSGLVTRQHLSWEDACNFMAASYKAGYRAGKQN